MENGGEGVDDQSSGWFEVKKVYFNSFSHSNLLVYFDLLSHFCLYFLRKDINFCFVLVFRLIFR